MSRPVAEGNPRDMYIHVLSQVEKEVGRSSLPDVSASDGYPKANTRL